VFCPLPFNHIFFRANKSVYPCCEAPDIKSYFDENIQKTANNDAFKKLRLEFLKNPKKLPAGCQRCAEVEKTNKKSVRQNCIAKHTHMTLEKAKKITNIDGSITDFHLQRLDIRSSNLCNYKCRFCGIVSSNSWLQDHNALGYGLPEEYDTNTGIAEFNLPWDDLKTHLPYVKELKLAGGEPVIMPGTYQILEEMINVGNTNCSVSLITNASFVSHGKKNIIELLGRFKTVNINLSIDGIEDAHAWLRAGKDDWHQVEKNIDEYILQATKNNWNICMHTSVSWMNMYHVEKLIRKYPNVRFLLNPVTNPAYYSISTFDVSEVEKVLKYYKRVVKNENNENIKITLQNLRKLIKVQKNIIRDNEKERFIAVTNILDKARQQSFTKVFPEFAGVIDES